MNKDQFKEQLKLLRFGTKRDFVGMETLTVTRGTDNIADIYEDGRVSTSFTGFKALPTIEKISLTQRKVDLKL